MPEEDAIRYMKEKAKASYLKKGQDVVDMNYKAIDLGATAYKKVDVPADWADAVDTREPKQLKGKPELVKMVKEILRSRRQDGRRQPARVSAFVDHVDGQFELGAAAYEKRGVAVSVPTWDAAKCIQCNQCAYCLPARHHPSLCPDRGRGRRMRPPPPRSWTSRPARARAPISSPWPSARSTAWAAACAWAPARSTR